MKTIPCNQCIVFARCKSRFADWRINGVIDFVFRMGCQNALDYTNEADQDDINEMRILYGLEPVR
jgi:hypothetical protein